MANRDEQIKNWIQENYPVEYRTRVRAGMTYPQLASIVQDLSGGLPAVLGAVPDDVKDERIFGSIDSQPATVVAATTTSTSGSVTVGSTITGAAGSSATVTQNGNTLTFTIPRGASGATGSSGADGAAGAAGSQGTQGIQGIQGAAGTAGTAGTDGATGATGPQGIQGIQGPAGLVWRGAWSSATAYVLGDVVSRDGHSYVNILASTNNQPPNATYWELLADAGAQGPAGSQGIQGNTGSTGATGSAGADGSQGIQGIQGAQGIQGDAGATGSQGPAGAAGTNGTNGTNGTDGTNGTNGRPAGCGAMAAYGQYDESSVTFDVTENALRLQLDGDSGIGMAYPAFNVEDGGTMTIAFTRKSDAVYAQGVYLRVYEYDSDLPDGKLVISGGSANPPYVQVGTRNASISPSQSNGAVSAVYETTNHEYTPTSTAKWASVVVLNWTAIPSTSPLFVKPLIPRPSAAVAGSDSYVLFNDGGAAGADSGLTFNKTTNDLTVAGYIENQGSELKIQKAYTVNYPVGWYTVALVQGSSGGSGAGTASGQRASGQFQFIDKHSGQHQTVTAIVSHHFGTDDSNNIQILNTSNYGLLVDGSPTPVRYIRIKELDTYDGCALQIYLNAATNVLSTVLTNNNQRSGWKLLAEPVPDATDPSTAIWGLGFNNNYSQFTVVETVDISPIKQGGMRIGGNALFDGTIRQSITDAIVYADANGDLAPLTIGANLTLTGNSLAAAGGGGGGGTNLLPPQVSPLPTGVPVPNGVNRVICIGGGDGQPCIVPTPATPTHDLSISNYMNGDTFTFVAQAGEKFTFDSGAAAPEGSTMTFEAGAAATFVFCLDPFGDGINRWIVTSVTPNVSGRAIGLS